MDSVNIKGHYIQMANRHMKDAQHNKLLEGFPGGAVVENPPADAGDTGLSPGPGKSHMPRSD